MIILIICNNNNINVCNNNINNINNVYENDNVYYY